MKMSCFLLLNILQFQEQSYAKEMALMGQITVELVFVLGMFPENAAPCSSLNSKNTVRVANCSYNNH